MGIQQIVAFDVGIRNFAYCILEHNVDNNTQRVKNIDVVDLGCSKNNKQGAIDAVIDLLDEIVFQQIDMSQPIIILIEQQMTATMKAIQVAINVFFKMTAKYHSLDITTKYLSAKHKLALRSKYPTFENVDKVATSKYKQNKMDGVYFGLWILKEVLHDEVTYEKIESVKKKDDMCDTLLMCMYYVALCV